MKQVVLGVAALAAVAGVAAAHETYLDPFGAQSDVDPFFLGQGFGHLDLAAVDVSNHVLQSMHMDILVNGDIAATNWGKFNIYFDTQPGGRTDNAWGRSITAGQEADWFIGGWADGGGGAELYQATPGGWTLVNATYNPGSVMEVHLTNAAAGVWSLHLDWTMFGLTPGQEIGLDVVTTAGGTADPGVDHLSLDTIATPNWSTPSVGGMFEHYHVEPAPGSIAVLGIAGMLAGRRRRS
jgi:hypothetical protein